MKASGMTAVLAALCFATFAAAQDTFTVDINRIGSGPVTPGSCFDFEIVGTLTDNNNEGLAFFAFDLEVVSNPPGQTINLGTAIIMGVGPGSPEINNFSQPQGYSVDFTGTAVGDDLIQAGGGQNTIGNTGEEPFPPFPMGDVTLGVGHGGVTLFSGEPCPVLGFFVPAEADLTNFTYTLQIKPNSLYANVITSHDDIGGTYVVDPVNTVIGSSITFGGECGVDVPEIVHGTGETAPCSGYIDPAQESSNGTALDRGITSAQLKFNVPVFQADGSSEPGLGNFSLAETGGGAAPTITAAGWVGGDQTLVEVTWDRPLTLQEWTTVIADVYNECGEAITSTGNQGPGVNEPDRVDIGFMPCDVNQGGGCDPFDLLAFRQAVNNGTLPAGCASDLVDYIDINRNGTVGAGDVFDLLVFRQLVNGVPPATQAWANTPMNNPRP